MIFGGDGGRSYEVDFLSLPTVANDDLRRDGREFRVEKAWAVASFGTYRLKRGWWTLDCVGSNSDAVEVRLSSSRNPLLVVPARENSARIHIAASEDYDLSLLISPWPGRFAFSTLRLRRLGASETADLLFGTAARLVRGKKSIKPLFRAASRFLAGQAVGLRLPSNNPDSVANSPSLVAHTLCDTGAIEVVRDGVAIRLRSGDRLHRDAVGIARALFLRDPSLRALFCDVMEGNAILPHPQWDTDLAAAGAFDNVPLFLRPGTASSSIADAVKRFGRNAIGQIPLPLVGRAATLPPKQRVPVKLQLECKPKVSVIIPTKHRTDLLQKCLNGLVYKTSFSNVEIVIVDNGATDPLFPELINEIKKTRPLKLVEHKGPFNFSRLVNVGVKAADGEIVVLLNDDIEPTHPDWLDRMVASALDRSIGAVGARLLYPNGSVQHAGVVLGLGGTCAHLWRGLSAKAASENIFVTATGARMAVTGACLAVRRSEYDAIGGFDEVAFPVAYNDIDFCLRLHSKGLRNIYRGDASLVHHESQSRGSDEVSIRTRRRQAAEAARFRQRWGHLIQADPHFSPAFDPSIEVGVAHRANFAPWSDYLELDRTEETHF